MPGTATDLECLESSVSSGTAASPILLQSIEVSIFFTKANFENVRAHRPSECWGFRAASPAGP